MTIPLQKSMATDIMSLLVSGVWRKVCSPWVFGVGVYDEGFSGLQILVFLVLCSRLLSPNIRGLPIGSIVVPFWDYLIGSKI